jgi:hypothetical protein
MLAAFDGRLAEGLEQECLAVRLRAADDQVLAPARQSCHHTKRAIWSPW